MILKGSYKPGSDPVNPIPPGMREKKMKTKTPKCEICQKPALGVCSSRMGAISHAYCEECIKAQREPWTTLVGGLFGVSRDDCADWVRPVIEATCKFYEKTEDELWNEVKKLEKEYVKDILCNKN
jgi:hypothetical protein